MNSTLALFLLSVLLSFVSSAVCAALYVAPWLRTQKRESALAALVAPHLFLRFIGLSVLVVGVVSPSLPARFAIPVAFGDLIAGLLALVATVALSARASWAIPAVWAFNVWGAADLLLAFYLGPHSGLHAGDLGATFFLPTAIVPPLLVTHFLAFRVLMGWQESRAPAARHAMRPAP